MQFQIPQSLIEAPESGSAGEAKSDLEVNQKTQRNDYCLYDLLPVVPLRKKTVLLLGCQKEDGRCHIRHQVRSQARVVE